MRRPWKFSNWSLFHEGKALNCVRQCVQEPVILQVLHLESSNAAMAEDLLNKTAIIQHYTMETKSGMFCKLFSYYKLGIAGSLAVLCKACYCGSSCSHVILPSVACDAKQQRMLLQTVCVWWPDISSFIIYLMKTRYMTALKLRASIAHSKQTQNWFI